MLTRLISNLISPEPHDVWFSRDIHNQELQHWMLVVKNRKFELVRTPQGDFVFNVDYERNWDPAREKAKPSNRTRGGLGNGYDSWIMVRIGWSSLSGADIDKCFAASHPHYPPRLSWTQAQDFLRRFAAGFVDSHDPNWRFFIDNTAFERQSVPQLPPPPAALMQHHRQQEQQQRQQRQAFQNRIAIFNGMQMSQINAQNQNIAMNNQIMQNQYNSY